MYEIVWQAVDPATALSAASHSAPSFAVRAASQPVAATLASLQLLQSHSQLITGRSRLSISTRSGVRQLSASWVSSNEVG